MTPRPTGLTLLLALVALAFAAPAGAQLPSNSRPVFVEDEGAMVGQYRYVEQAEGLEVDVRLNGNHSASYRVSTEPGGEVFLNAEGYWSYDGQVIHIHNHPGPARLEPSTPPTYDPSVGMAVSVTGADGTEPLGLGVTWPDANGLYMLSHGRHTASAHDVAQADQVFIVRAADRKVLWTGALTPGGPNSFAFVYDPSDAEPFDFTGIALDERADRIEMELGTASVQLGRVVE